MDTLAHAVVGGLFFSRSGVRAFFQPAERPFWKDWTFWAGCAFGVLPDLTSFGIYSLTALFSGEVPGMMHRALSEGLMAAAPPVESLPAYIGWNYAFTHSLLIVLLAGILIWYLCKPLFLPFLAWPAHILCDIPVHGGNYFQTPLFWPLADWSFDGWSLSYGIIAGYWSVILALIICRLLRSSGSIRACIHAARSGPRQDR